MTRAIEADHIGSRCATGCGAQLLSRLFRASAFCSTLEQAAGRSELFWTAMCVIVVVGTPCQCFAPESYRFCRRAHSEGGWSPWHDQASIPRSYESEPSGPDPIW